MGDAAVTGIVLVLLVPVVVFDGVTSTRAGYGGAFWSGAVEDKLTHIAEEPRAWSRLGAVWLPLLTLACAGLAAFSIQLADAGEGTWAFLALGAYLVGAFAWLVGLLLQTMVARVSAQLRAETGTTPEWFPAFWQAAWWAELTFVVSANVAFVLWGVGMLGAAYPATWAGWTMLGLGGATLVGVAASRDAFPHLGILAPVVLGIALLVS